MLEKAAKKEKPESMRDIVFDPAHAVRIAKLLCEYSLVNVFTRLGTKDKKDGILPVGATVGQFRTAILKLGQYNGETGTEGFCIRVLLSPNDPDYPAAADAIRAKVKKAQTTGTGCTQIKNEALLMRGWERNLQRIKPAVSSNEAVQRVITRCENIITKGDQANYVIRGTEGKPFISINLTRNAEETTRADIAVLVGVQITSLKQELIAALLYLCQGSRVSIALNARTSFYQESPGKRVWSAHLYPKL